MTRQQAEREARKRWGKKAIWRAGEKLSSPEIRADADATYAEAKQRLEAIDAEMKARLTALDWYQALRAEQRALLDQKSRANGWRFYHKFSVGQDSMGIAFCVEGSGDTWEEAFAQADARKTVKVTS